MSFTVDIDTGGTFTDGLFAGTDAYRTVKVLTTPHDLTVCFLDCIEAGAGAFGLTVPELLKSTDVIRYSNTIGTNAILTRSGPKLGLLVTRGAEQTLYDDAVVGPEHAIRTFVAEDMVVGIRGAVSPTRKTEEPDPQEVLHAAQLLVDQGARALVVSLAGSWFDPTVEQQVRQLIKQEFPRFYLGSPMIFLASEISDRPGEAMRTAAALINAYIHPVLARYLYKAEETLRQRHFAKPLLIGHNNGGTSRVAKTRAISTWNSGPVAGLRGATFLARHHGFEALVSSDMGGTSMDIGVVQGGQTEYDLEPEIEGLRVNLPLYDVKAIAAGGGSIAWVDRNATLRVGPQSAGSTPGPACFNRGGTEPTVTDADVVLGLIDPGYFLGGRIRLDPEKAARAIERKVARPLGITVEEAALRIKETVDSFIAAEIRREMENARVDPASAVVLAYGGAGPTHCAGYSDQLGVKAVLVTPFSPVFSAFGSSTMDVNHKYSAGMRLRAAEENDGTIARLLERLTQRALQDMRGEGFAAQQVTFAIECLVDVGMGPELLVQLPVSDRPRLTMRSLLEAVQHEATARGLNLKGETPALTYLVLNATALVPHFRWEKAPKAETPVAAAKVAERNVYWRAEGYHPTAVYRRALLGPGHVIDGPAVIESEETTCVLPPGYRYTVDEYLNGVMTGGAR